MINARLGNQWIIFKILTKLWFSIVSGSFHAYLVAGHGINTIRIDPSAFRKPSLTVLIFIRKCVRASSFGTFCVTSITTTTDSGLIKHFCTRTVFQKISWTFWSKTIAWGFQMAFICKFIIKTTTKPLLTIIDRRN